MYKTTEQGQLNWDHGFKTGNKKFNVFFAVCYDLIFHQLEDKTIMDCLFDSCSSQDLKKMTDGFWGSLIMCNC